MNQMMIIRRVAPHGHDGHGHCYELVPPSHTQQHTQPQPRPRPQPQRPAGVTIGARCAFYFTAACFFGIAFSMAACSGYPLFPGCPAPSRAAGGVPVEEGAVCVRLRRRRDYLVAELPLGTPARLTNVLVRLDYSVASGNASHALRVGAARLTESSTLECDEELSCSDVVRLTRGVDTDRADRAFVSFRYYRSETSAHEPPDASTGLALGLDGELLLKRNSRVWLGVNELCWTQREEHGEHGEHQEFEDGAMHLSGSVAASNGRLFANASELQGLEGSNLLKPLWDGTCATEAFVESVELFPVMAAFERDYLHLMNSRVFDLVDTSSLNDRRNVVQLGQHCANALPEYERALSLYLMDCRSSNSMCQGTPSLAFRLVADHSLYLDLSEDAFKLQLSREAALQDHLGAEETVTFISAMKLLLMVLAAATLWIRTKKNTSAPSFLFIQCVRAHARYVAETKALSENAHCDCPKRTTKHPGQKGGAFTPDVEARLLALEDAALGLLCCIARVGVVFWRWDALVGDGQQRAATLEILAGGLSIAHWVLRWISVGPSTLQSTLFPALFAAPDEAPADPDAPLSKLGGSSAILDATQAVLVLYAQTPLLISNGGFDETARLLISVLVVLVTSQRSCYAAACCALHYCGVVQRGELTQDTGVDGGYRLVLLFSVAFWVFQASVLAVSVADLVVAPFSYGVTRTVLGSEARLLVALATLSVLVAISLPGILQSAAELLRLSKREL